MNKKERFRSVLEPIHKTYWERVYKKLAQKMSALKSSLKRRSYDHGVIYDVSLSEIEDLFYKNYGKQCKYCETKLRINNMVCDHIVPIAKEGDSVMENLQLICRSCNSRKGPLDEEDFKKLVDWVNTLTLEVKQYVLRKLAKGGRY
tara:strand:+ start:101 stop:538 length:438 start_codon:yes stop_codon:yes gene_type:complete